MVGLDEGVTEPFEPGCVRENGRLQVGIEGLQDETRGEDPLDLLEAALVVVQPLEGDPLLKQQTERI